MRELQNNMASSKTIEIVSEDSIRAMIMPVRGQQVMLDRDLAILYGVEVKYLDRQVKRNIERFPADFMFQLTKEDCLRCQIGTLNGKRGEHLKYMPYRRRSERNLLDRRITERCGATHFCRCENGLRGHPRPSRINPQGDNGAADECCQCDNVAIYQFPISSRGGGMMEQLETGNIGIGNTSTLATFNKCFGFTRMDAGEIDRLKKAVFGTGLRMI